MLIASAIYYNLIMPIVANIEASYLRLSVLKSDIKNKPCAACTNNCDNNTQYKKAGRHGRRK